MAFIKKYPWDVPQVTPQFFQLTHCLSADENAFTLPHGIPEIAAVLGYAA